MARDQDLQDIIDTLIAEALGEGDDGLEAVAEVINNRSAIRGISPGEVVRQPRQFTGYEAPGPAAVRAQQDPATRARVQSIWEAALGDGDITGGADHYFNPNIVRPAWAQGMTSLGRRGDHDFYSSRPIPPGSLPSVASQLSTQREAPTPASASPQLARQRAGLTLSSNARAIGAGDSIGLNPVRGGSTNAPEFDAVFDSRTGSMRKVDPYMGWGNDVGRSVAQQVRLPDIPASTLPSRAEAIGQQAARTAVAHAVAKANPISASDKVRSARTGLTIADGPAARPVVPQNIATVEAASGFRFPKDATANIPTRLALDDAGRMPAFSQIAELLGSTFKPGAVPLPQKRPERVQQIAAPQRQQQSGNVLTGRQPLSVFSQQSAPVVNRGTTLSSNGGGGSSSGGSSSGGGGTIRGSSTGNSYNVGQTYQAGGYEFTAKSDGTFERGGRVR